MAFWHWALGTSLAIELIDSLGRCGDNTGTVSKEPTVITLLNMQFSRFKYQHLLGHALGSKSLILNGKPLYGDNFTNGSIHCCAKNCKASMLSDTVFCERHSHQIVPFFYDVSDIQIKNGCYAFWNKVGIQDLIGFFNAKNKATIDIEDLRCGHVVEGRSIFYQLTVFIKKPIIINGAIYNQREIDFLIPLHEMAIFLGIEKSVYKKMANYLWDLHGLMKASDLKKPRQYQKKETNLLSYDMGSANSWG